MSKLLETGLKVLPYAAMGAAFAAVTVISVAGHQQVQGVEKQDAQLLSHASPAKIENCKRSARQAREEIGPHSYSAYGQSGPAKVEEMTFTLCLRNSQPF